MKFDRVFFAIICCLAVTVQAKAQTMYTITEIPLSRAYDLNNNSKVIGSCHDKPHICTWAPDSGVADLGIPYGLDRGLSINDSNQVIGNVGNGNPDELGDAYDVTTFIYDPDKGVADFDTFVRHNLILSAINNAGQVVGDVESSGYHPWDERNFFNAIFWGPAKGLVNIGTLIDSVDSTANDINNLGQVVGYSGTDIELQGFTKHAFIWDATNGMRDLGTLGGDQSEAYAINDAGQVVGYTAETNAWIDGQAFVWDATNGMHHLGNLGGESSEAFDINDDGQVVGWAELPGGSNQAFIWDATNGMVDLNTLLLSKEHNGLLKAHAINRDGEILAEGKDKFYLLTPEPDAGIEVGEVDITHRPVRVNFSNSFSDPVVVARLTTKNGSDPCMLEISDVDKSGFTIQIKEYQYLNGVHTKEMVSYLVMESGHHILSDGTRIEAGIFSSEQRLVSFQRDTFTTAPVIMTSVTTMDFGQAVTGRIKNITTSNFEYRLQTQEKNCFGPNSEYCLGLLPTETISYIAWEPGSGKEGSLHYEVGTTENVINHKLYSLEYMEAFANTPIVLADIQTTHGPDTATLAVKNSTDSGLELFIEEETSRDQETSHVVESAGYIVLSED